MQRIADRDMHERDIIALVPLAENKKQNAGNSRVAI